MDSQIENEIAKLSAKNIILQQSIIALIGYIKWKVDNGEDGATDFVSNYLEGQINNLERLNVTPELIPLFRSCLKEFQSALILTVDEADLS